MGHQPAGAKARRGLRVWWHDWNSCPSHCSWRECAAVQVSLPGHDWSRGDGFPPVNGGLFSGVPAGHSLWGRNSGCPCGTAARPRLLSSVSDIRDVLRRTRETLITLGAEKKQVSRLRGMAQEARHSTPLEMTNLRSNRVSLARNQAGLVHGVGAKVLRCSLGGAGTADRY